MSRHGHARRPTARRGLAWVVIAALGAVAALAGEPVTDDQKKLFIDEQLRFADGLLDRGHHALAIEEYQRLIRQFPDDPLVADAWMQLAEAHAAQGRTDVARKLYEGFLEKFPGVATRAAAEVNYARLLLGGNVAADQERGRRLLGEVKGRADIPEVLREAASYYLARDLAKAPTGRAEASRELRILADLPVSDAARHRFRAFAAAEVAELLLQEGKAEEALRLLAPLAAGAAVPPEIQNTALQMTAAIHWNSGQYGQAAEAYGQLAVLFPDSDAGREAPLRRIESLYRAKDGRSLIREADLLLAKPGAMPYRDRILYLKAATLQEDGFLATAASAYAELVVSGSDNETVQKAAFQQVCCLRQEGKHAEVVKAARGWLGHRKLFPETVADIVIFAAAPPTPVDAGLALLREAVAAVADPRARVRLSVSLAGMLLEAGRPAEALPVYQAAAATPNQAEFRDMARIGAAVCLEALGQDEPAIAAYREILAGDAAPETSGYARLRLALLLLRVPARWPEAEAELTRLCERQPADEFADQAAFYLGYLEFARGGHAAAERRLAELLRRKELSTDLRLDATAYYLWTLLEQGRDEEVRRALGDLFQDEAFLARAPAEFLLRVAEHWVGSDPGLAMIGFAQVAEGNAVLWQRALLGRGQIHAARGEAEMAVAALREAIATGADPAITCQAHARLGELLVANGKPNEAMVEFEQALDQPSTPDTAARARLGLARILAGQEERLATANRYAMSVFILGADPALSAEAMLLSIQLSLRQGRNEEAASTWRELRQRYPEAAAGDEGKKTAALLKSAGIDL
jgi:tetratricopeptide (TPR) repeat protein